MCMVLGMADCAESFKIARRIVADIAQQESEDATPESIIANQNASRDAWNANPERQNDIEFLNVDPDIENFLRDCISRGGDA